jgi:tetratricopeptide (TPR) repeat protein
MHPRPLRTKGHSGTLLGSHIFAIMTKLTDLDLVTKLEDLLLQRNAREGFQLLEQHPEIMSLLNPSQPGSISLLLCIAQWIDLGYRALPLLEECYARFSEIDIANARFIDALKLKLVEAFLCLSAENLDEAISRIDMILSAGHDIMHPELRFTVHFWKGRAHRKRGDYDAALLHITTARKTAQQCSAMKLVAVAKIHESWLLFQRGERRQAIRLLDEAEEELRSTGHALSLGNIQSARGRFVRRSGEYARALAHFEHAIEIYAAGFSNHPNCARALVNAAYVKRLIALDMQARTKGAAKGATQARYLSICREALDMLARAGEIYGAHHHQTGTGSVLVNAGHLHLESGDIDRAAREAEKAFALGKDKHDQILMARARILHSAVELTLAEEDIEEDAGVEAHAALALEYADESVELAHHTQNNRLLAAAYITRGLVAAADFFEDWEAAKSYAAKANDLLNRDDRDHLLKELTALKTKLLHSAGIDPTLRQWSEGYLGNKTFQQIQEEFAEIVIPKVWLNNGKNVTRVAQQLSISPKKVRRILRNVQPPKN